MTEYGNNISFWGLLTSKKIVIPIIQRDYAQGRIGKEYLRERFLGQLFDALQDGSDSLVLDFVYGTVEEDTFYPLDGQQRLTTLWLLHWYLALCAGTLSEDSAVLQRFSYETRVSSRTFCQMLCNIDEKYEPKNHGIRSFIRNQRWYYSTYDQDPTIQSMLRMLEGTDAEDNDMIDIKDGIEEYCVKYNFTKERATTLLERLKDRDNAPIRFNMLNIEGENMPLTDDLYIKMNARGKILTDFENFKADLLKYKCTDREYLIPEEDASREDGFSVLMDTRWTDLFWHFHSDDYHIDEIYMIFLNRFFLNWYIANTTIKPEEVAKSDPYVILSAADCHYKSMSVYEPVLTKECIDALTDCLNNLCKLYESKGESIDVYFRPDWVSSEDKTGSDLFFFIPHYKADNNPTAFNLKQQVVFQAICTYLVKCKEVQEDKLKDWVHFAWNMVENSYIDQEQSISAIRFFGRGINELPKLGNTGMSAKAFEDIITYLAGIDESQIKGVFGRRQLMEEIAKAKQIKRETAWKEKIQAAESVAFFKGAISFLFTNEYGKTDWNDFDKKKETAKALFDKEGVLADKRVTALHTLYSYCDDFDSQFWWNAKIFNCRANTWKDNILTKVNASNEYIYAKPVHHLLKGDSPSKETKQDRRLQVLADENFVKFLVCKNTDNRDMYIRDPHDALYYCGRKCGVMLSYELRDSWLNKLLEERKIELTESNSRIENTGLFWGDFSINFIYLLKNGKSLHLQWFQQRNDICYDIYLMTEDWNYKRRENRLVDAQGERQEYYCFNIDDGNPSADHFEQQIETEFKVFLD